MKGLLLKDVKLLKGQGAIYLALTALVAIFVSAISDVSPSYVVAYITGILSIFSATTISYDEFDNCYPFLMTLPVTRKKYVDEEYLFGILTAVFAWCVGMTVGTVLLLTQKTVMPAEEWVGSSLVYICIAWVLISIMIPLRLKFDAEKSKYATIIAFGVIIVVIFGVSRAAERVSENITGPIIEFFVMLGDYGFLALSAGVSAAVLVISYVCSRRIMAKKEF